jgi:CheY-like chemotaxis protein
LEIPAERAFECGEEKRSVHRPRVTGIRAGVEPAPGILVVDDVEDNSDWLRRLLKTIGFPVRVAGSGEAAIAIWEDWRPGLILMDIHMPGIDGLEAAKRIKALPGGRQTVIVALTADSTEVHRGVILSSGADDFLSKPCQEDELLEKIRLHLGLSYIYADGTPEGVEGGGPGLEEREAELLDKLPARFVNSLREATLNGNRARLEELIEEIRQCGLDKVAALFQELADSYQYDRLVELLESEENHAASTS